MAYIDYIEHTSIFIPLMATFIKNKNKNSGVVYSITMGSNNTLSKYYGINQLINKRTLRKRFSESHGYALKYKDKYYLVTDKAIYECSDLDDSNLIVTQILVITGYIINQATGLTQTTLLVHSSFDMSILKKKLWYSFRLDAVSNILIINRNIFSYITKVEKTQNYTYFNNIVIPTLKQSYLQQLEQQIAEYDG